MSAVAVTADQLEDWSLAARQIAAMIALAYGARERDRDLCDALGGLERLAERLSERIAAPLSS